MKKFENQTSTLSFKAIEAKARRAAAAAEKQKIQLRSKSGKSKKGSGRKAAPDIEQEIKSIFNAIKSNAPENESVFLERCGKFSSCSAIIRIYLKSDLIRQNEEEEAYKRALAAGADRNMLEKPFKANPTVMYSLYPATLSPQKLGSVAIYGANPQAIISSILKRGFLFGRKLKNASIEIGRRPFVNVNLAA